MNRGVILYGPPAVGKDTITAALIERDTFVQYRRVKSGPGRSAGYRMVDAAQLAAARQNGLLWENHRYGATYLVERRGLDAIWHQGRVPVVHVGQPEAVHAIVRGTSSARWMIIELYAPLAVLQSRISQRGTGDDDQRLTAVRQTPRLLDPDLTIDTSVMSATEAATTIEKAVAAVLP